MAQTTLKQMLFNLLTHFETQYREKAAMQVILDTCGDARTRKTWRQEVEKLLSDPAMRKAAHVAFEPIYAQIAAANDDSALAALLSQFPITGKTN